MARERLEASTGLSAEAVQVFYDNDGNDDDGAGDEDDDDDNDVNDRKIMVRPGSQGDAPAGDEK